MVAGVSDLNSFNIALESCQWHVVSRSGAAFYRKCFVLSGFMGTISLTVSGSTEAIVYIDLFYHCMIKHCFGCFL